MIQIAVIGAGHWGPNLIRNFDNGVRSRVRWVVDSNEERLGAVRARFPGPRCSQSASEAIEDPEVDAVVVATPTVTHAALVRAALEAGKHVFVEKPLTDEGVSSREIQELAERLDRVLLVGHVFLYNPAVRWIKERIDAGELGQIHYISSARTNLGPIRLDVNVAWDLAAQDIAIFNYWLGNNPISVSAVGSAWINPGVHDAVFATLRYPGDVLAHLHVSWLNPRKVRMITVVASGEMLTYDDMNLDEPLRLYDKRVVEESVSGELVDTFGAFRSVVHNGAVTIPPIRMGEPLAKECEHFLDCVETGSPALTGGREGLAVVRALEAIDWSLEHAGQEGQIQCD